MRWIDPLRFGWALKIGEVNLAGGCPPSWATRDPGSRGLNAIGPTSGSGSGGECERSVFSCSSRFSRRVFSSCSLSLSFSATARELACSSEAKRDSSSLTCRSLRSRKARWLEICKRNSQLNVERGRGEANAARFCSFRRRCPGVSSFSSLDPRPPRELLPSRRAGECSLGSAAAGIEAWCVPVVPVVPGMSKGLPKPANEAS